MTAQPRVLDLYARADAAAHPSTSSRSRVTGGDRGRQSIRPLQTASIVRWVSVAVMAVDHEDANRISVCAYAGAVGSCMK